MNAQHVPARTWHLAAGRAERLSAGAGELMVVQGRVWVTARGDESDHVLSRGERLALPAGTEVVVEPWDRSQGAVLRWAPQASAHGLRLRGALAGFFGALARRAASSAS